jgi:hypothetical protein
MSGSWGLRGNAAIDEAARSIEAAKQRSQRKTHNFRLKPNESAEIIILDENLDHAFGLWEQTIPGPDASRPHIGSTTFVSPKSKGMIDPMEEQPLVNGKKSPAKFVLYLSVLDLRPYTNAEGKVYPHTRKLLPIKAAQKDDILRKLKKRQDKNGGKLRGLHLQMVRGSDDKSAAIGSPEELDSGDYGFLTEDQLNTQYGHAEIKNQAGVVVVPANGRIQAIKYEDEFVVKTTEEVRRMCGAASASPAPQTNQNWDSIIESDLPTFDTESDLVDFE